MKSFIFVLAVMLTLGLATIASAQVTSTSVPSALTITPAGSGIAIANVDCDVTDVIRGAHYTVLFFLGTVLFLTTFVINFLGDYAISRMKRRLGVAA